MVGLIDKLRSQLDLWKVEKYTKRRTFLPEYDSRGNVYADSPGHAACQALVINLTFAHLDTEYYKQHYYDGVYYSSQDQAPPPEARTPTSTHYRTSLSKRMSVMIKKKSSTHSLPSPRCSETYNANQQ
ncbi:hypothetical protein [Absidia glauca]|uniref:Uncharacterized protein n=1 Tax=Absidia glauca TaxID=4829 RepID=A0A163JVQ0_ABSGL|nr:hypothetical protein [Absidia glauca]